MSLADLPPPDTKRWVASRKAAVVAAVDQGLIGDAEACTRYGLTAEELASWRNALDEHGVGALRTTRLQLYRPG
jgi:transposase-like protein